MYICPICFKSFADEADTVKHYISCWKEHYPHHQPHCAIHSSTIEDREITPEIVDFFQSLRKE